MSMWLLALTLMLPSMADQNSKMFAKCMDQATTQHDMHVCAGEEFKRVQRRLDQTYAALLSRVEKSEYESEIAPALKKIKVQQTAWVAYRDAYMDAMYPLENKQAEYGSMYPMEAAMARTVLTQRQVNALNDLLERYAPDK